MVPFFYSLPILVALDMINYKYLQLIMSSLILSVFTIQILLMFVFMTKKLTPSKVLYPSTYVTKDFKFPHAFVIFKSALYCIS